MRRGFKAQAERLAQQIRSEMGTKASSGLDAAALAAHAGADVRRADEFTSLSKLKALEALQPGAFSACTFHIGGRPIIVYSPLASHGRTQSDLAWPSSGFGRQAWCAFDNASTIAVRCSTIFYNGWLISCRDANRRNSKPYLHVRAVPGLYVVDPR